MIQYRYCYLGLALAMGNKELLLKTLLLLAVQILISIIKNIKKRSNLPKITLINKGSMLAQDNNKSLTFI